MRFLSKEFNDDTRISEEWLQLPDLYPFWKSRIFHAAVKALFGPYLLSTPSFEQDFWKYVDETPALMKSMPSWMVLKAYGAHDRVFAAVKTRHRFARAHSDYLQNSPKDPDWDDLGPDRTQNGKYPLNQFWAERFLVPNEDTQGGVTFSQDELSRGFIPFGGGPFMCPKWHFAKQEFMGSAAVLKEYYDV
ncbi:uncharacterized protein BDW70DRAFT_164123 [Aspergillus foveolatus]|uniref:uncharacterized protein n=1 Tax=Aspergillus foveolatus TaxID=210207 RepID=UPI003CCDF312